MNQHEPILELYQGQVLLAIMSDIELDNWPWYKCKFHPTPIFEQYRPLFDHELALLEGGGAADEWDAAYAKIEELGLTLSYPTETKTTAIFLLHVEGQTARFKAVFD